MASNTMVIKESNINSNLEERHPQPNASQSTTRRPNHHYRRYNNYNQNSRVCNEQQTSHDERRQQNTNRGHNRNNQMWNISTFVDRQNQEADATNVDFPSRQPNKRRNNTVRQQQGDENMPHKHPNPSKPRYNQQISQAESSEASSGARDKNRREILTEQLRKNKYECMICYQYIRNDKPIWSCRVCFHIFHLQCIKKWANSSTVASTSATAEWRCPGCQTQYEDVPIKSTCFCSKKMNPEQQYRERRQTNQLAHSCGEVCGKPLVLSAVFYADESTTSSECKHKCVLLCHPGPCPQCETIVTRSCLCGKSQFQVKCSSSRVPACDKVCDKLLSCGRHRCNQVCHGGACEPCKVDIEQACSSHGHVRTIKCGSAEHKAFPDSVYLCDLVCDKELTCKNHFCQEKCHLGPCKPCPLMPSNLTYCPCGKTLIRELLLKNKLIRTSCKDPVPTCDKPCGKLLKCPHNLNEKTTTEFHTCGATCHTGECPECERTVEVRCRCGKESETVKCGSSGGITKLCDRRCQKKKSCGRHQCGEICCNDKEHICMQVCNKLLSCGLHRCEELCHKGACKRCLVASFEERVCRCGATIQYPPIRCGTKPLECPNKCTRVHACDHPVTHNCHWEDECPPCSFLTSKMCMGGHEMRHNIPCHMKDVSCGNKCNKPLLGLCSHRCQRVCHKGACVNESEKCTQPCQRPRPHCDHICGAPCHEGEPCPDTVCQEIVVAKCKCGLKSKQLKCGQKMHAGGQVMFENLASQLKEMLSTKSIDVASFKSQETLKKKYELECDEECFIEERNRKLGQVLLTEAQVKPKPIYSDWLKTFAREDPQFAANIEKRLESLVTESKLAKTGKKSLALPVMRHAERRFVHELAAYYGVDTQSFDYEPHRNVCLYATREKAALPALSLTQVVDVRPKQSAMPKVKQLDSSTAVVQTQLKVLNAPPLAVSSSFAMLQDEFEENNKESKPAQQQQQQEQQQPTTNKSIDYFDLTD